MRGSLRLLALAAFGVVTPAGAQVIDDIAAIGPYVDRCVTTRLGRSDLAGGRDATFRLSFRRDGSIIGDLRVVYSFPQRGDLRQEEFLRAALEGFRGCAPLPFSRRLGEAIAGRIFTFRYTFQDPRDPHI